MAQEPSSNSLLDSLLRAVLSAGGMDTIRHAAQGIRSLYERLAGRAGQGTYEVLQHHTTVELLDRAGETAVIDRQQKVRFLQDYVSALTDYAWGDGEIFARYECSPGRPVDFYQDGSRHAVLISLRETKGRGDVISLDTRREVRKGFTKADESWETDIYHRIAELSVSIIFPKSRHCQRAVVSQQSTSKTTALGHEHFRQLADGRQQVKWTIHKPRLHDRYALKWRW